MSSIESIISVPQSINVEWKHRRYNRDRFHASNSSCVPYFVCRSLVALKTFVQLWVVERFAGRFKVNLAVTDCKSGCHQESCVLIYFCWFRAACLQNCVTWSFCGKAGLSWGRFVTFYSWPNFLHFLNRRGGSCSIYRSKCKRSSSKDLML